MQPPSEKSLFVENGLAVQQSNNTSNNVKVQAMAAMQAQVQHLQM